MFRNVGYLTPHAGEQPKPLAYEVGTDTMFRNVGYLTPHAGNNPKDYTQYLEYSESLK
jgi:hypothetical protein